MRRRAAAGNPSIACTMPTDCVKMAVRKNSVPMRRAAASAGSPLIQSWLVADSTGTQTSAFTTEMLMHERPTSPGLSPARAMCSIAVR